MTTDAPWTDLAGRMFADGDGRRAHTLAVRVYHEDTDFSGVAYHGSYVRWCERGRSDFLRLLGAEHRRLLDGAGGADPSALMVRRMTVDYLAPARIDDVLEVTTRVKALTAATLVLDQGVRRIGADDSIRTTLMRAEVTIVLVTVGGRVLRISKVLGEIFGS